VLDQLITLSERKTNLLKELRESQKYESCKYHLVDMGEKQIGLFEIATKKLLVSGFGRERVEKWVRLRKINHSEIYNF